MAEIRYAHTNLMVTIDIPDAGRLTLVYMCDPEGNILELQHWH